MVGRLRAARHGTADGRAAAGARGSSWNMYSPRMEFCGCRWPLRMEPPRPTRSSVPKRGARCLSAPGRRSTKGRSWASTSAPETCRWTSARRRPPPTCALTRSRRVRVDLGISLVLPFSGSLTVFPLLFLRSGSRHAVDLQSRRLHRVHSGGWARGGDPSERADVQEPQDREEEMRSPPTRPFTSACCTSNGWEDQRAGWPSPQGQRIDAAESHSTEVYIVILWRVRAIFGHPGRCTPSPCSPFLERNAVLGEAVRGSWTAPSVAKYAWNWSI